MDNWVFNTILAISGDWSDVTFVLILGDLIVHTFFRIAFGIDVRPNQYRRLRGR